MLNKAYPYCKARRIVSTALITALLLLTGCATTPYDYSALIESKPRSIVVLPPLNDTVEIQAPYTFLSTISVPLAEKGYYVFPVAVIDTLMKENGLPTPAEMNNVPLDKIREIIGADAVLYVKLQEWGQKFEVLSSRAVVRFSLRLVDTQTGTELWTASGFAQEQSDDGGMGLAGAIIGAIVTQVMSAAVDKTPNLARTANTTAIHHQNRGLLNGPYKIAAEEAKEKEAKKKQPKQ